MGVGGQSGGMGGMGTMGDGGWGRWGRKGEEREKERDEQQGRVAVFFLSFFFLFYRAAVVWFVLHFRLPFSFGASVLVY